MDVFELAAKLTLDTKDYEDGLNDAESKGSSFGEKLGNLGAGMAKLAGKGVVAAGGAALAVTKMAISSYADYEQLVGGVETLFGDSSDAVIANADKAFKTAGLSANEYMETVTGFSASLLQSVGGDTVRATELADQAIIDMADNANKMGSSMESIQTAYSGFSKQNFTMLDNLKLGYGGTKQEMERLLEDATALSGVEYDISSYADIVDAIHVVQNNLGITGTTAKEASETISGSIASTKSAWENLVTGLAQGEDISGLFDNLVESAENVFNNVLPVVENVITNGLPSLIESGSRMVDSLVQGVLQMLPSLVSTASSAVMQFANIIVQNLPLLVTAAMQIILTLSNSIATALPDLIPTIVDVMITIVMTLIDNVPLLVESAIAIILGLTNGILEALPTLIEAAPEIVSALALAIIQAIPLLLDACYNLVSGIAGFIVNNLPLIQEKGEELIHTLWNGALSILATTATWVYNNIISPVVTALSNGISEVYSIGSNIVEGLWNGITDKTSWLTGKISGFCSSALGAIKSFFGIESPSKVMRDIVGANLALGIGVGFEREMSDVEKNMVASMDGITDSLSGNVDVGISTISSSNSMLGKLVGGNGTAFSNGSGTIEMPIYLDSMEIARGIFDNLTEVQMLRGATI